MKIQRLRHKKIFFDKTNNSCTPHLSRKFTANCSVVMSNRLTGFSKGCIFAHTLGVAITTMRNYINFAFENNYN